MSNTKEKLRRVGRYLSAHPDNEECSECADRLSDVQDLLQEFLNNESTIITDNSETLVNALKRNEELENLEKRFKEMADSARKSFQYLNKVGMECSSQCSMAMNTAYLICADEITELLNKTK